MIDIEEINQGLLNKLFSSNVLPYVRFNEKEIYPEEFTDNEWLEINKIIKKKSQ